MKDFRKRLLQLSLIALFSLLLTGCAKVPLYSGLGEQEINEMMAILLSRGISCKKVPGDENTWSIQVPQARMAESVEILGKYGYPKDKFETIGQVFQKSGLVSSPSEERIRFMYALTQSLSETIAEIDGVLVARVHIVLQENDPLAEVKSPASASVFIKYRRGTGVNRLGSQIKQFVTNSIEGLTYDKVSLVFVPSDETAGILMSGIEEEEKGGSNIRIWLIVGMGILLIIGILAGVGYWLMQGKKLTGVSSGGKKEVKGENK